MRKEDRGDPQTIVREEDLASSLRDGWPFVSVLPSKRILIRIAVFSSGMWTVPFLLTSR